MRCRSRGESLDIPKSPMELEVATATAVAADAASLVDDAA
jgi:hypothetical protein